MTVVPPTGRGAPVPIPPGFITEPAPMCGRTPTDGLTNPLAVVMGLETGCPASDRAKLFAAVAAAEVMLARATPDRGTYGEGGREEIPPEAVGADVGRCTNMPRPNAVGAYPTPIVLR